MTPSRTSGAGPERGGATYVVRRPALRMPLRVVLLIAAASGLAALALYRPSLPPDPWARIRPEPRDLIEAVVVFLVWLGLVYALLRIAALALRPPQLDELVTVERPAWAPPRRRVETAAPAVRRQPDALLELFARPPLRPTGNGPTHGASGPQASENPILDVDLPLARETQE